MHTHTHSTYGYEHARDAPKMRVHPESCLRASACVVHTRLCTSTTDRIVNSVAVGAVASSLSHRSEV